MSLATISFWTVGKGEVFMDKQDRSVRIFTGQPLGANHENGSIESVVESVALLGYAVLPFNFAEQIADVRKEIDRLYLLEVDKFGLCNLEKINDVGVVRNPFLFSKITRDLITDKRLIDTIQAVMGFLPIVHVNRFVISDPSVQHPASVWHREPPYNNFIAQAPFAITAIHFPDGSNSANSGVKLMPCSHKWPVFPSDCIVHKHSCTLSIQPGEILLFDSNLLHCGGPPGSALRRSIVTIYTAPIIKQHTNLAHIIETRYREILDENPNFNWIFGVMTNPHNDDLSYRNFKLNSAQGIGK
jgi:hypothetical protein